MAGSSQQTNAESDDAIQRDGDYWFDDGNLILTAKNHDVGAHPKKFRIHIGILARHSRTFKGFNEEAFQFASPDSDREEASTTSERCPLVRLDASYHDVKAMLRAIYDSPTRTISDAPIPFSEAAALTRLGREFGIESIMMLGLQSLNATFNAQAVWTWHSVKQKGRCTPVPALSTECIEAANLFRIIGCSRLRITALYACSAIDPIHLAIGVVRADGFVEKLPPEDLVRCLGLRACMDALVTEYITDILALPPRQGCEEPYACNKCVRQSKPLRIAHSSPVHHKTLHRGFGPIFPDWKKAALCKDARSARTGGLEELSLRY
ncbi:hypothetical protein C8Q70DRAFT_68085 [Cubamyces menziesii]|nr:hypothetical protein C8Q70DRAFT_68085 [Cubamyces menziesii]